MTQQMEQSISDMLAGRGVRHAKDARTATDSQISAFKSRAGGAWHQGVNAYWAFFLAQRGSGARVLIALVLLASPAAATSSDRYDSSGRYDLDERACFSFEQSPLPPFVNGDGAVVTIRHPRSQCRVFLQGSWPNPPDCLVVADPSDAHAEPVKFITTAPNQQNEPAFIVWGGDHPLHGRYYLMCRAS